MECDDDCTPVGVQSLRQDAGEKSLQVLKLAIGCNSQGLEDTGGRMGFGPPSAARVKSFIDRFDQVGRCLNGLIAAAKHNGAGDRSTGRLFAKLEEQVRQFGLVEGREEIGRRHSLRRVKSHVERTVNLKAEAAAAVGQLIG
jgi:hypothetical protein